MSLSVIWDTTGTQSTLDRCFCLYQSFISDSLSSSPTFLSQDFMISWFFYGISSVRINLLRLIFNTNGLTPEYDKELFTSFSEEKKKHGFYQYYLSKMKWEDEKNYYPALVQRRSTDPVLCSRKRPREIQAVYFIIWFETEMKIRNYNKSTFWMLGS